MVNKGRPHHINNSLDVNTKMLVTPVGDIRAHRRGYAILRGLKSYKNHQQAAVGIRSGGTLTSQRRS
jgi:hypothetical protein